MVTAARPIDYTNLGYDALREAMIALARESLPEWTDVSKNDLGVLLIELFAYANDITQYYQTRIANNLFPATSDEPEALVQLLRLIGYELRPAAPATTELYLSFDAATIPPIEIPARTRFTAALSSGAQIVFETTRDQTIPATDLAPPDARNLRRCLRPIPVIAGQTVTDDPIATDGSPNQMVTLGKRPIILGSTEVSVLEPSSLEVRWQEVPTLAKSSPADRHFTVQRDAEGGATIVFGDGVNGMIPPRGTSGSPALIKVLYRVGGGPEGNVSAGTRLSSALSIVAEAVCATAAAGGAAQEDLDRARRFAPRLFRTQDRAVTSADFEDLALQVPGVGKARAVALSWNTVALCVAPAGQVAEPSELLIQDLLAFFEPRRMAGASVKIVGPTPVDVGVTLSVRAQPYFLQSDVKRSVEQAIAAYLDFDAVDFGQQLYLSKIYEIVQDLPGVISLTVSRFNRDGAAGIATDGVIATQAFELPRLGSIELAVTGGVVK